MLPIDHAKARRLLTSALLIAASLSAAAQQVAVTVVDAQRQPVEGATVTTFDDSVAASSTTDAAGNCVLAVTVGARAFRLRVDKPGWFHSDSQWLAQRAQTLLLRRAVALECSVVAQDSADGLAGARVELVHPECRWCAPEEARADEHGVVRFAAVPAGIDLELRAGAPGFPRQRIVLGALREPQLALRRIELARGCSIRGRVFDLESGAPIAGATIATVPGRLNETSSDVEGRFEIRALAESFRQRLRLRITAPERCELALSLGRDEWEAAAELECPLVAFAAVAGVVRDAGGRPLGGVEVALREDAAWLARRRAGGAAEPALPYDRLPPSWNVSSGEPNRSTTTDGEGRFRFAHVVPWTLELALQCSAIADELQRVGPLGAPGTTLEVELKAPTRAPSGRLHGSVTLNGQPLQCVLEWSGATRAGRISSAVDGRFESDQVEPGEVRLRLVSALTRTLNFGDLFAGTGATVGVALDAPTRHDFALECKLATIVGRVTVDSGGPPEQAFAAASETLHGVRSTTLVDGDGRFELAVPQLDAAWRVVVVHGPEQIERAGVRAGDAALEFVVAALERVRLRFVDARTGASLGPADVMWRAPGSSGMHRRSLVLQFERDAPDWFTAEIPRGRWELGAWPTRAGYPPSAPRAVEIGPDAGGLELEFRLAEGRPLTLRLAAASERPPRDDSGRLWLLESEWWGRLDEHDPDVSNHNVGLPELALRYREIRFDAEGTAHVPGVRAGRYRFVPATPGDVIEPAEVTLAAAGEAPIEILWRRRP